MQNNVKSSSVAGVLGVFLGAFGGHDWYLGNTKKAITHVCLCVGGIMMLMVGLILRSLLRDIPALDVLSICVMIGAYVIIVGNGIWGFIEGVMILAQGDAGLAAKGYQVAAPTLPGTMPAPQNTETSQPVSSNQATDATIAVPTTSEQSTIISSSNINASTEGAPAATPAQEQSAVSSSNIVAPQESAATTTAPAINPATEPVAKQAIADPATIANVDTTSSENTPASTGVDPSVSAESKPEASNNPVSATPTATTPEQPAMSTSTTGTTLSTEPTTAPASTNPTTSTPEPAAATTTAAPANPESANPATPNAPTPSV